MLASPTPKPRTSLATLLGADVRSLAALRIALAACVLADIVSRACFIGAFLTDLGIVPRQYLLREYPPLWIHSLFLVGEGASFPALLLIVEAVFAFGLLFGYRTKLCTIVVWFLTLSVQVRNPLVNQGGDILLRMLLFWSMFLPLGETWSIDRLRRGGAATLPTTVASFGTLGFGLQIALLYLCAALIKYQAPEWSQGTAVYYALNLDQLVSPFGASLLAYPRLLEFATKMALLIEALCPLILYFPWKNWIFRCSGIALIAGLHISFFLCFELGPFPWISMTAMLFFIPGNFWDSLSARSARMAGLRSLLAASSRIFAKVWPVGTQKVPENNNQLLSVLGQTIAAIYLLAIAQWNANTLREPFQVPALTDLLISFARADQEWSMFAPAPQKDDGWFVIEGKLIDGSTTDLFKALPHFFSTSAVTWEKPRAISRTFPSERWRKYFMNIELPSTKTALAPLAQFLCRSWNESHQEMQRLSELTIYFVHERTPPPGGEFLPEKEALWATQCMSANTVN